jgi:hypothetical protein
MQNREYRIIGAFMKRNIENVSILGNIPRDTALHPVCYYLNEIVSLVRFKHKRPYIFS